MAAVFKPHRELTRGEHHSTPNTAQELLSRQTRRHQWASAIEDFHAAFQLAWDIPDLYTASPAELHSAYAAITDAQDRAAALRPHLKTIWRDHKDLEQLHRLQIESNLKTLRYIAEGPHVQALGW